MNIEADYKKEEAMNNKNYSMIIILIFSMMIYHGCMTTMKQNEILANQARIIKLLVAN
jgi:hypothetical protein